MAWTITLAVVVTVLTALWPRLNEAGAEIGWAYYRMAMRVRQRRACGICQATAAARDRRVAEIMISSGLTTPGGYAIARMLAGSGQLPGTGMRYEVDEIAVPGDPDVADQLRKGN